MKPLSKRTCPVCMGKKDYYAQTCRRCQPKPAGWPGRRGPDHPAWKGGFQIDRDGYVRTYDPDHQWPRLGGYVLEHVRVMELHIGRRITSTEAVHHVDHDKRNNTLTNLELVDRGAHSRLHRLIDTPNRKRDRLGRFASGGDA